MDKRPKIKGVISAETGWVVEFALLMEPDLVVSQYPVEMWAISTSQTVDEDCICPVFVKDGLMDTAEDYVFVSEYDDGIDLVYKVRRVTDPWANGTPGHEEF